MMRGLSSSRVRWLTAAAFGSKCFRQKAAEFPEASSRICGICDWWTFRGPRPTDGVPSLVGALRPFNHSLNINDKHELLPIREAPAAFARRVPTQRRSSRASGKAAGESAQENILAALGCVFRKRQARKETGHGLAQWRTATTAGTQT